VTKITHKKRLAQQKHAEKRRKTAITSTPSEEIVEYNGSTYVKNYQILWTNGEFFNLKYLANKYSVFLAKKNYPLNI
jgi:hypothetical protein